MKRGAASKFAFIDPKMPLRVRDLPGGDSLYEKKFDGYRALAFKAGKEERLVSPNQRPPATDWRPEIADCEKSDHPRQDHRA